jgi:hypothetical protein
MNKLILAGAAALAFTAAPAAAQDMAVTAEGDVYVLTAPQQTIYDAWPAERKSDYMAWPRDYQAYYWTLTEPQQNGWWVLTPDQRTRVFAMTPEQRVAAWTAIERQMASMPSANASATAQAATTAAATNAVVGSPRFVSNAVVQTTPSSVNAPGMTEYPPCKGDVQDSCINPREAGLNYGNRPLNYWPGKPASEIPGKKPMKR